MNYRLVIGRLGLLFGLLGLVMLGTAAIFGIVEILGVRRDPDLSALTAMGIAGGVGLLLGGGGHLSARNAPGFLGRREALLLVALSWILGAALAALPFFLWVRLGNAGPGHPFGSFVGCYFEAMSGLTTAGASVLTLVEEVPDSLLLWRATTHWLGGLGIVVLFVAVLPGLGVGGKRIFAAEAPGPSAEGLQPHIRETARWLWYIYIALTLAEIAALWCFTPMDLFDSVCHTFATIASGGFSTRNASVGAYAASPAVDYIVILFMIFAGVNFGLFYKLVKGQWREVVRDTELRVFLALLALGTAVVVLAVWLSPDPVVMMTGEAVPSTLGVAFRQGLFTTTSIQTTTGFGTSDSDRWPFIAVATLVMLTAIGGSAGSTAGGIKVIRVWVAIKVLLAEIEHAFRPQVVRPLRFGRTTMDPELKLGTIVYILGTLLVFLVGSIALMLSEQWFNPGVECTYKTTATAVIASFCTTGPGFGLVGTAANYGWISEPGKLLLCAVMLLGRLEIFAIVVLFSPRFWRYR